MSKEDSFAVSMNSSAPMYDDITFEKDKNARRQRKKGRLVRKDGECNISNANVEGHCKKMMTDILSSVIDLDWGTHVILFTAGFTLCWLLFGLIWWLIAVAHGDHLPEHRNDENWVPCMLLVYDFTTSFLFSFETQHTTGYGSRDITPLCEEAAFMLMLQSYIGICLQAFMAGIIFAKMQRPKRRAGTVIFSEKATVFKHDNDFYLSFRIGYMRKSHIIHTEIRAIMVKHNVVENGEMIPLRQYPMKVKSSSNYHDSFVSLIWPTTILHKIDQDSPLWNMSASQLQSTRFEIIIILEGLAENTGQMAQYRNSYVQSEILWGYKLSPLISYHKENGRCRIEFTRFHSVTSAGNMPNCSARTWCTQREDQKNSTEENGEIEMKSPLPSSYSLVPRDTVTKGGKLTRFKKI